MPIADRDVAADPRLARAGPDDVRIGRRDRERADGRTGSIKIGFHVAGVRGLENAARRGKENVAMLLPPWFNFHLAPVEALPWVKDMMAARTHTIPTRS